MPVTAGKASRHVRRRSEARLLDEAAADGEDGGLGAVLGAELLHDVDDVVLDGVWAEVELGRDLFISQALDDVRQDLLLALSQALQEWVRFLDRRPRRQGGRLLHGP